MKNKIVNVLHAFYDWEKEGERELKHPEKTEIAEVAGVKVTDVNSVIKEWEYTFFCAKKFFLMLQNRNMKKIYDLIQHKKNLRETMPESQEKLYSELQKWEEKRKPTWKEKIKRTKIQRIMATKERRRRAKYRSH